MTSATHPPLPHRLRARRTHLAGTSAGVLALIAALGSAAEPLPAQRPTGDDRSDPVIAAHSLPDRASTSDIPRARRNGAGVSPGHAAADTLRLYYMGHHIGRERWTLERAGDGQRLDTDFDYVDRGRRTHLAGRLEVGPDWSPRRLQITRITDSTTRVETRVEVRARRATVVARGESTEVALPERVFAIAGHTPVAQHLALLRYWRAHGRPSTLAVVPGDPTNVVTIEARGRDTLALDGRRIVLERYAIDGVVWGREAAWLDERERLAAFSTAGGGGLVLEAVREELAPLRERLVAIATRDRLADLARLSRSVRPMASGRIALVGATLIDGTGSAPVRDAVVVVERGRIVAAGPRASVPIPAGARRIDLAGRTIAPGLWDMHTHLMQVEWAPVYLAAGVTTVRDMGNETDFALAFRAAIDSGRAIGPRVLLAGLIDGPGPEAFGEVTAATPEEGRAVVRRYHALGFEQVKLYTLLRPDVVAAIAREAHRLGMTVTGHVPAALSLVAAVDSGMDQIAHMPIRGDAGSDSVRRTIDHLRARGTVIDPTASWAELLTHSTADPVASFQPGVAHLPPVLAQRIRAMGIAGLDTATAHARLARTLGVVRALHEAGVPVVAGTDEGVPGYSVYREIELYATAGMPPIDAIRAASAVSAKAMRLDAEVGTLEAGKRADLIVLDGNPLDDIRDIGRVRLVMKDGTLWRSADLWRAIGFRAPVEP